MVSDPVIDPMRTHGARHRGGALSGFGTMTACAPGALCAMDARSEAAGLLGSVGAADEPLLSELAALRSDRSVAGIQWPACAIRQYLHE